MKKLYNPWTGMPRHPDDVKSDPEGLLMVAPGEPLAATQPSAAPGDGRVIYDVRRFGAKIDGVTDDTAAVQRCYDALVALPAAPEQEGDPSSKSIMQLVYEYADAFRQRCDAEGEDREVLKKKQFNLGAQIENRLHALESRNEAPIAHERSPKNTKD